MELSSWEQRRQKKVAQNLAKLRELGLAEAAVCMRAPEVKKKAPKQSRKRRHAGDQPRVGTRCSKRSSTRATVAYSEAARPRQQHSSFNKPSDVFGEISGFPCGSEFYFRVDACHALVHRATVAGIVGNPKDGCYSIVLNGGYPDDVDLGDALTYTGSGGQAPGGSNRSKLVVRDQTLDGKNAALAKSIETSYPVRVLRGSRLDSQFAPLGVEAGGTHNYRYDGLYVVVRKWQAASLGSAALVWKFALTRVAGQPRLSTRAEELAAVEAKGGLTKKQAAAAARGGGNGNAGGAVKKKKTANATKKGATGKAGASAEGAVPWQTDPSAHEDIGTLVARRFGERVIYARVVGWVAQGRSRHEPELFRIKHSDGDEEDLEAHELVAAKSLAAPEALRNGVVMVARCGFDEVCMYCQKSEPDASLLLCDATQCRGAAHAECLTPPLDAVPEDDWFCPKCTSTAAAAK